MRTANRKEIADIMGVSLPTIDSWIKRGCPFVTRGGKGKEWLFNITSVIKWREGYVVELANRNLSLIF